MLESEPVTGGRTIARSLACLLIVSAGCASHLEIEPPAPPSSEYASLPRPLVLDLVELSKAGYAQTPDEGLANRVAMELRQSRRFAAVFDPIDAHAAPRGAVRAAVSVALVEDPHSVANGVKGLLTWLSLFLLTPVLRFDFDTEVSVDALVRTCDGWSKRFTSRADGSLRGPLFSPEHRSDFALRNGAIERALALAVADIGRDAELAARVEGLGRGDAPAGCRSAAR